MSILKTIYLQHLNGANANMTLTSNERVGIGTSSPSAKLHVSTGTTGGIALLQGSARSMYFEDDGSGSRISTEGTGQFSVRAASSGGNHLTIDSSGRVTKPYQPFFHAYGLNNLSGSGTDVIYPSASYNIGGHYSTATGRFTAPVNGYYMFGWTAIGDSTNNTFRWRFRINGSNLGDVHLRQDTNATGSEFATNGMYVFPWYLSSGDYVNIWYQSDTPAAPYANNSANDNYPRFWGYLLG